MFQFHFFSILYNFCSQRNINLHKYSQPNNFIHLLLYFYARKLEKWMFWENILTEKDKLT